MLVPAQAEKVFVYPKTAAVGKTEAFGETWHTSAMPAVRRVRVDGEVHWTQCEHPIVWIDHLE
jgi:hypothetical protein